MTRLKKLSIVFACTALLYALIIHFGGQFANREVTCQNVFFKSIQPWDSACFYSAIFQSENDFGDLYYEKYHLDLFTKKGGHSPNIKWYRSVFYRQFKDVYKVPDKQIEDYHWAYMRLQPEKIQAHINYLKYLKDQSHGKSAQSELDKYCTRFIRPGGLNAPPIYILESLANQAALDLDMQHCKSRM
jgi:hypothetical protein